MPLPQSSLPAKTVRFGSFAVDLASGELHRNGTRVRLQEQPFQVLAALLEQHGQVVTRENLRQKLWPEDTFVDFDHSLNTAVNKIREALGDSAASPHYVETVAKRGYRFIGTIDFGTSAGNAERAQATADSQIAMSGAGTSKFHSELNIPLPHRAIPRFLFALIQVMYVAFYLEALFRWRGADSVIETFLPAAAADPVLILMFVTSAIGIAIRCYFISAIAFDYQYLRKNFERIFLGVLVLDEIWAMAPFLAANKIGFGVAVAASAALLYVPFAERTLLRMAYPAKS